MPEKIILDFGSLELRAELFDLPVCGALVKILPATVELTAWGGELYGTIPISRDEKGKLVPSIPPGGIAYSHRGSYLCIFFGQTPAWPVEHIGNILGNAWKKLNEVDIDKVIIRKA